MSGYMAELRAQWRPIVGGFIGMSAGLATTAFVTAIMGRYLVDGLGWTKSQFALGSIVAISSALAFPFAGRLGDIIGPRRTALIGVIAMPIIFFAFSQMTDFKTYLIINVLQCLLTVTTTAAIYCRIIVQYVHRARGLALAVAAAGPGIMGIFGPPLLGAFVAEHGWRAGYLAMTAGFAVAGAVAIWLLPPDKPRSVIGRQIGAKRNARRDFAIICRMRAFWIILGGMFLMSIPYVVLPQMSLILRENGISGVAASFMISTYAIGMLLGRVVSGIALDRFPPPVVTAFCLALSSVGIFAIASGVHDEQVLFGAILLIGLSYGSESDILAYLIARNFGVSVYSTIFGMVSAINTFGSASGALLLSFVLKQSGFYAPFLFIGGGSILVGSLLFLLLPHNPIIPDFDTHPNKVSPLDGSVGPDRYLAGHV